MDLPIVTVFMSIKKIFFSLSFVRKKLINANIYENENFFQKLSYYIFLLTKNIRGSEKKNNFYFSIYFKNKSNFF